MPTEIAERQLWLDLRGADAHDARDQLLALYDPLACSIASRLYKLRLDDSVSHDDYLQYAREGLLDAVKRFDCERGVAFKTYASTRIRGTVLSGIAKESEAAAQRSAWSRRMSDRVVSLRTEVAPIAEQASLEDMAAIAMGLAVGMMLDDADGYGQSAEVVDPSPTSNPYFANELYQLIEKTRSLIRQLPPQELAVINGHYIELLDFQSLATRLSVTKGRVSQVHARALLRLRSWLCDHPELDNRV